MLTRSFHNALCDIRRNGITVEEAITKHGEWMTDGEEEKLMKMFRKSRTTQRTHGTGNNAKASHITSITVPTGCEIRKLKKSAKPCNSKEFRLVKGNKAYKFEISEKIATICGAMRIDADTVRVIHAEECDIERARACYKALIEKGYKPCNSKDSKGSGTTKKTAAKSEKTDSKKTAKKTKSNTKKATAKKTGGSKKTTKKSGNTKKTSKSKKAEKKVSEKKVSEKKVSLYKGDSKYEFLIIGNKVTITDCDIYCQMQMTITDARNFYRVLVKSGFKAA